MIYLKNCKKCKKQTQHKVIMTSRKYGVKLQCLSCGDINSRYHKLNNLKETEMQQKQ